jgi:hypothetical protein
MSVGTRRLAAAQRTAVRVRPSRAKRLAAWIIIVPALALFSFSVVAGAAGLNAKPDVASAAAKVVPQAHDVAGKPSGTDKKQDKGGLVLVDSSHDGGSVSGLLDKGGREVCWISASQLVRVSAAYRTTSTTTVDVGGRTYPLVTVYEANEQNLKRLLASAVKCRLVQSNRLFFLPFDPNLS